MPTETETCENCGRSIGKLEEVHLWKERTVCAECVRRLRGNIPEPNERRPGRRLLFFVPLLILFIAGMVALGVYGINKANQVGTAAVEAAKVKAQNDAMVAAKLKADNDAKNAADLKVKNDANALHDKLVKIDLEFLNTDLESTLENDLVEAHMLAVKLNAHGYDNLTHAYTSFDSADFERKMAHDAAIHGIADISDKSWNNFINRRKEAEWYLHEFENGKQ